MSLQAGISNLASNDQVGIRFDIRGTAYNASAQGSYMSGGLQAFYRYASGRDPGGAARTFPDAPTVGELPIGYNSEFATNPVSDGNWWILNDATFRATYGLPGNGGIDGQRLPPWQMRKVFGQVAVTNDDSSSWGDNFLIRMEGRLVVPTSTNYSITGGGDDRVVVYVDGYKVLDSSLSAPYGGQVFLQAGEHGFTADFQENGGAQYYFFSVNPAGTTLKANASNEHSFAGYALDYGCTYAEQRPGMLTLAFRQDQDGITGWFPGVPTNYWKGISTEGYGDDVGPSPQKDNYRMYMVGYWYVPTNGLYDFQGGADDRFGLAITNDPAANPWTIGLVMSNASVPSLQMPLTQGWVPFRMEFGEGGGAAAWWMQWRANGGSWDYFRPASYKSTADPAYDWTLITSRPNQYPTNALLASVRFPLSMVGNWIDLRLRAVGSDRSCVEQQARVKVVLPAGALTTVR